MQASTQFSKDLESFDYGSYSRSRTSSLSSDSQASRISLLSPPPVNPSPAFVSNTAASEVVRSSQFDSIDFVADQSSHATAAATSLLNGFLDHLLFNILASAKSTKLSHIRSAMIDVFRPHLAKELVSIADGELSEYVGDTGSFESESDPNDTSQSDPNFDLTRAWKLARLRCMIYTRLGDLEEEDEDEYITQDYLDDNDDLSRKFSPSSVTTIAPTTAIFLTAVVEYIGEQALAVAGHAAYMRLYAQERETSVAVGIPTHLIVQEVDLEKLALNPTLGRLWRTWRRRVRSPGVSRTLSRDSVRNYPYHRHHSKSESFSHRQGEPDPSSIPLPPSPIPEAEQELDSQTTKAKDMETPKSAADEFEVVAMEATVAHKVRPRSLMVMPSSASQKSVSSASSSPVSPSFPRVPKAIRHVRSRSLPDDYTRKAHADLSNLPLPRPRSPTTTSVDRQKHLSTMIERDEQPDPLTSSEFKMPGSFEPETYEPNETVQEDTTQQDASTVQESQKSVVEETNKADESSRGEPQTNGPSKAVEAGEAAAAGAGVAYVLSNNTQPADHNDVLPPSSEKKSASEENIVKARDFAPKPTDNVQPSESDATSKRPELGDSSIPSWPLTETALKSKKSPIASQHIRRQSSPVTSPGLERAAVQRLSAEPALPTNRPVSHRSDSPSSFAERQSTSSPARGKLKGLIGRSNYDSSSSMLRHSSDTSRSRPSRDLDDQSGLDRLIHSDETIRFTLTPKNMRDMEVSEITAA